MPGSGPGMTAEGECKRPIVTTGPDPVVQITLIARPVTTGLDPVVHSFSPTSTSPWMPGSGPGMTAEGECKRP